MGYLAGSQFNLAVSLRYEPETGEIDFLCELFGLVSRILSDSTDGALSIGSVLIATDSRGGNDADIWVHPNDQVWPNSTSARLWFPHEAMDLSQDYLSTPTIFAHELGHYLFGLRDEYGSGAHCVGKISRQASLMENYGWGNMTRWEESPGNLYFNWASFFPDYTKRTAVLVNGQPSEFCHVGNHDVAANHPQNNWNGQQSCWTYIANDANHNTIPYGLVPPGASGPKSRRPPAPPPVTCSELIAVQRTMLIVGRSKTVAGDLIDLARTGANFWVDYVNASEEFGLATDAGSQSIVANLSAVPAGAAAQIAWRNGLHDVVKALTAGGTAALGDALRASLLQITAAGRAASQVIVVLTDGREDAGVETVDAVLPDLRAAGVRVYTIGIGADQNGVLLANIALATGGSYFAIPGDLSEEDAGIAVTDALIALAAESRENGGTVSFRPIDDEAAGDEGDAAPPFDWGRHESRHDQAGRREWAFRFSVPIAAGSERATLGALWTDPDGALDVTVTDPSGRIVEGREGMRRVVGTGAYGFYEIEQPAKGRWTVEVTGAAASGTRFRTIGFETNDRVSLDASVAQPHVRVGESIELRARIRAPLAVPGAQIVAHVLPPSGRWRLVEFTEHVGSADDPNEPFTYTAAVSTSDAGPGPYLIVVDATRAEKAFDLELDELYRGRPGLPADQYARRVEVPEIQRRAVLGAVADEQGRMRDEPIAGYNTRDAWLGSREQLVTRPEPRTRRRTSERSRKG